MLFIRSLLFNIVAWVSILLAASALILLFWAPRRIHSWLCVSWCRFASWSVKVICGVKVEIEGRENIPDEPSVIMLKHTSTFETFWHVTLFPQTVWVVKRELLWIPIIGWAISLALDPIAIKRSAGGSAIKQVMEQGKDKLSQGIWVSIFPEGTRMPPGETRKYGSSGAALARDANVKIVPVAHNAGDFWQRRSFTKRPGTITVRVGAPIDPAGQSPKEVNLVVQKWIETQMHEISSVYKEKYVQPSPD